jgi:hypothetical protein
VGVFRILAAATACEAVASFARRRAIEEAITASWKIESIDDITTLGLFGGGGVGGGDNP